MTHLQSIKFIKSSLRLLRFIKYVMQYYIVIQYDEAHI